MLKSIAVVVLYVIEARSAVMIRARWQFGEGSESDTVYRFWRVVGNVGYTLQAWVGRVDEKYNLDLSTYIIERAYGSE